MKRPKSYAMAFLTMLAMTVNAQVTPTSQMENLDRGVVVVPQTSTKNFISWRLLGTDSKEATTFDLLRNGVTIAQNLKKTNYTDTQGSPTDLYTIVTKVNGEEKETSEAVSPWNKAFLTLKLDRPATGTYGGTYTPNDMSVGDVDGDGKYELIVKWDPSNSQDNSIDGVTDNVIIDCYKMDATKLWRVDLGRNIRAGAHYTQFLVYDFDGDGKAEMICKTAPGSKDGNGNFVNQAALDQTIKAHDNTKTYIDSKGRVNDGPEYLTVFNGTTGEAIHTTWYLPNRAGNFNKVDAHPSSKTYWGDNYGGRADRFLASVAYINGADKLPCAIFSRGYYTRSFIWAISFDGQQIHTEWLHDSSDKNYIYLYSGDELNPVPRTAHLSNTGGIKSTDGDGCGNYTMYGNGNHNMAVADVDGDGCDEIIWGAGAVNNDGKLLYSTGYGHGDAMHVGKMIPDREGLQVFDVHEDKIKNGLGSWDLHDAATGEIIHYGGSDGKDNGRGMAADLTAANRGYEFWSSDVRQPYSAVTGKQVISKSCSVNFRIYWDGDAQDELFDGSYDSNSKKANPYIQKWNGSSFTNLVSFNSATYNYGQSCNTTKATPCLMADLFGDWREELILWNYNDPSEINIYTTTIATDYAVPTLMHDHTYRMGITWQQTAYNQPPHLGYYLPDYLDGKLTGIEPVNTIGGEKTETIYDLSGRKTSTLKQGINIVRTKSANGIEVKKVIVK